MNFARLVPQLQLAVRAALAGALSVAIAKGVALQYPIYALVGAVVVTDLSPVQTRRLGVQRLAGTVIGAMIGGLQSGIVPPGPWAVGIGIVLAMSLCSALHLEGASRVTGYVCGIVLLEHTSEPWSYAFFRLLETALGIVVAMAVSLLPKLIRVDEAEPASGRSG
jgi:uncharacterized membrane protein YgaE (UPF0421/DUF939 family)